MDNTDDLQTWCDLMAWRYRIGKDGPNYPVPCVRHEVCINARNVFYYEREDNRELIVFLSKSTGANIYN